MMAAGIYGLAEGDRTLSRGDTFLKEVRGKIKKRIEETDAAIYESQRDIAGMNEYYWENYTEMDQYGYESYDNQRALLTEISAGQEKQRFRSRLKKMLDAPFFGSITFVYEGEEETEDFYIGIGNFAEERGSTPLIYDWRAPVSSLFYDYDKGEASYEAPAGMLSGEILSKWQYKIRDGRMIYEFESYMKIDDEILKQELGTLSDTKLKNIIRTIQKEQNAIIRNTKDKILAIQGVAGSGKTSVALHRIAYLLYHDREHLHSSNVLVLSPNSVFSDYISHILPELGEENIREMSLDIFAYRELQGIAGDCEDRYHQIERKLAGADERDEKRYKWKQSKDFIRAAEGFFIELEDRLVDFRDIEYRGFRKKAEEILDFFYNKYTGTPVLSRMGMIEDYFIDEYETLYGRTLRDEELEEIHEKFRKMYVTTDIYVIYNWFLEENGWDALPELPVEKRVLPYEDVYPVLYMKYRLCGKMAKRNIRHLVIDEMQDYSYLQYVILNELFSCSMTILGDKAQTVDEKMQDVLAFLPDIFGKKMKRITMNKSYRNTAEIAAYAQKVSEKHGIEYMNRHGRAVEEERLDSLAEAMEKVIDNARLDAPDGYEMAAVLTRDEASARKAYAYLKKRRPDVSYIDRNSSFLKKGMIVTTFYMAKGLEFDQVFVIDEGDDVPLCGQFRYISATRALHELYVYQIK